MTHSYLTTAVIPVPDNHHSGPSSKCYPFLHDIECPPGSNWARSLAASYMQNPATQASIHYIVDAKDTVCTLEEEYWAWGSGSPSSQHGIHVEQAGYASFTEDQWLGRDAAVGTTYQRPSGVTATYSAQDAKDMAAQYLRVVALFADICTRYGWKPLEASNQAQLEQMVGGANLGKGVRHRDASEWVGGTHHTDPGEYPWAKFIADVNTKMGNKPTPTPEDEVTDDDIKKIAAASADLVMSRLRKDKVVSYAYTDQGTGKESNKTVSVTEGIGSSASSSGRAAYQARQAAKK